MIVNHVMNGRRPKYYVHLQPIRTAETKRIAACATKKREENGNTHTHIHTHIHVESDVSLRY